MLSVALWMWIIHYGGYHILVKRRVVCSSGCTFTPLCFGNINSDFRTAPLKNSGQLASHELCCFLKNGQEKARKRPETFRWMETFPHAEWGQLEHGCIFFFLNTFFIIFSSPMKRHQAVFRMRLSSVLPNASLLCWKCHADCGHQGGKLHRQVPGGRVRSGSAGPLTVGFPTDWKNEKC